MKMGRIRHYVAAAGIGALALTIATPSRAIAQDMSAMHMSDDRSDNNALVKVVRQATERFKDVRVALAEGYALQFNCVSGGDFGAMGLHYVNGALVNAGVLDAAKPQIVLYEAQPDGRLKLTGADYLVIADQWNATHTSPPELMGQLFHLFDAPNRFNLPAFYTLHVWAWKDNPNGTFVNWNPNVSCDSFNGSSGDNGK